MNIQKLISGALGLIPWSLGPHIERLPIIAPLERYLVTKFLDGAEFVHRVTAAPAIGMNFKLLLPEDRYIFLHGG